MTRVVLIGAGHAHLHVVRRAAEFATRGIELVLVEPGRFWYSGLATGMLGGMYEPREDQIDPAGLAGKYGVRLVSDRAIELDRSERVVDFLSGRKLAYDLVSLNLGSVVSWHEEGLPAERVWTAKPIEQLWGLRHWLQERFESASETPSAVLVVGGGPTGCEIAANVDALARRHDVPVHVRLVTRDTCLASDLPPGAARVLTRRLVQRGIEVITEYDVERVESGRVTAVDGRPFRCDAIVVATGLVPAPEVARWKLPVDPAGGLLVDATLCCIDDPRVFGAGDCIGLVGHDLPRLGVFGVRQAPVLLHNLLAAATGGRHFRTYTPQRRYLAILNLGCGQGLATWGRLHWCGRASLWLKDWIDRRFLAKYR